MVHIYFAELVVGHITDNSAMLTGDNRLHAFAHQGKVNEGFGAIRGLDNRIAWNEALLYDRDRFDVYNDRRMRRVKQGERK